MDLLVSLLMHEVESVLILVKELVRSSLHVDGLDLCTCCESVLEDTSVLEVSEFCLYECRTLAWLYMLEPYDLAWLSVVVKVKSVLEISCCCHKKYKVLK